MSEQRAREAARAIAEALNDRRGLHICDLDEDVQAEIHAEFAAIIHQHAASEVQLALEEALGLAHMEELSCGRGDLEVVEAVLIRSIATRHQEASSASKETES